MSSKPIRVVITALIIASLLSLGSPATAEARSFDFGSIGDQIERMVGGDGFVASLWSSWTQFVAASGAAICGDG